MTGETIDVVAPSDYRLLSTSIATKTDTLLLEIPQAVTVIDRQLLDDMQAINVSQAHDYAAGFTPQDERGPAFSRGFPIGFYDLRRDGLRTYTWSVREPVALERIQYLRGPAGILYGDGSPGGLVNLVLKKPLPVPRYEVSLSAGELGYVRGTVDATGPLSADRRARYRVVAAGEGLGDGYENDERRMSVLPMLSWDISEGTTLNFDGEYYDQNGRGYRHVVPVTPEGMTGDFSGLPWDLNLASPDDSWRGWNASAGARLDSRLGPRTSLHLVGRYTRIDGDLGFQALLGLAPDQRTVLRGLYREKSDWDEYHSDAFVTTAVTTGSLEHRLVVGGEAGLSAADVAVGIAQAPPLDMFSPVYGPRPDDPALRGTRTETLRLGLYVQDQMRIGKAVIVVPGLRVSHVRTRDVTQADSMAATPEVVDDVVSPRLGIVVQPRSWMSLYASYNRGFEPSSVGQYLEGGRPLEASHSESFEGGVKAELGSRISAAATGFRITQTNVPELQPTAFYLQIGEGRSVGLELEAVGRITSGIVVQSGLALMQSEITRDTAGFSGRELPNAPSLKANVWLRYQPPLGAFRRFTLSSGVVHVSERFVTRDNAVPLPSYTRLDAGLAARIAGDKARLSLAAQNLLDTRYVTSGTRAGYWVGPPRRVALTLATLF